MRDDDGWIKTLLDEAENERMHLMTFIEIAKPNGFERLLVILAQGVFYNAFFVLYLIAPKSAHRFVGYLEEEAIVSYSQYLAEIDAGRHENVPAPEIAIRYWGLAADARLRDVVFAIRADEAKHRDVNHTFADAIETGGAQRSASGAHPTEVPSGRVLRGWPSVTRDGVASDCVRSHPNLCFQVGSGDDPNG
jgi:ubiquinol oxidase